MLPGLEESLLLAMATAAPSSPYRATCTSGHTPKTDLPNADATIITVATIISPTKTHPS